MLITMAQRSAARLVLQRAATDWNHRCAMASRFYFPDSRIQHEAILSRQMRFTAIVIVETAGLLIGFVAAIVAAWYGAGYWALVLNQLVMTLVTVVGVWTCLQLAARTSRRADWVCDRCCHTAET